MAKPVGTGTFSNLGHTQAFEAVNVIRRSCANFHLGPGILVGQRHCRDFGSPANLEPGGPDGARATTPLDPV